MNSVPPTIVLFDIDGTLVSTGSGRKALEGAFDERYGSVAPLAFSFAGLTDRAIVRAAISGHCGACTSGDIERLLDRYLELLADEVERCADYLVHPGCHALITALAAVGPTVALGLGTGNLERGAHIKLGRSGLLPFLPFGGFGSDHEDRARLLHAGALRGAKRLGVPIANCRIVIVGDTPHDIRAAHAIGAVAVAVATGPYSPTDLRTFGAEHVFDTLADAGVTEAILGHSEGLGLE